MTSDTEATPRRQYGEALQRAYLCLGLSQSGLGELTGIDPKTIREHENGTKAPQPRVIRILVEVLQEAVARRDGGCRAEVDALAAAARLVLEQGRPAQPTRLRSVALTEPSPARKSVETEQFVRRISLRGAILVLASILLLVALVALPRTATLVHADFQDRTAGRSPLVLAGWASSLGATDAVEDGEYVLRTPPNNTEAVADLDQTFARADSSLAVDARVVGNPAEVFVSISCRFTGPSTGYGFAVIPGAGEFVLGRYEGPGRPPTNLMRRQVHLSIHRRNTWNRLELTCAGDTIGARINGEEVAREHDGQYPTGGSWVGVGAYDPANRGGEVHFDNLDVRNCGVWGYPGCWWISTVTWSMAPRGGKPTLVRSTMRSN
jgi:hypothetical protein